MERVDGGAFQLRIVGAEPARHHRPEDIGVGEPRRIVARHQHAAHLMGLNVGALLDQGAPAVKELSMITAMLKVHLQYGFSSVRLKGITAAGAEFGPIGYEMNLLYITGLLTLALSRPTKLSLDHWLRARTGLQKNR